MKEKANYSDLRTNYKKDDLVSSGLRKDPFDQFELWLRDVLESDHPEPTAMGLSTVDGFGQPHSRIVLLKGFDSEGLNFYTNYESDKARQIDENNKVSALFFWPLLERQVRIQGIVEKLPEACSDDYFASRPRESQIGAWASPQSEPVESYQALEERYADMSKKYSGQPVPRPAHWGGYRIVPEVFEFWQGRPGRLHQRFRYLPTGVGWIVETLAP